MSRVRPLRESDIPSIARLHRAAFSHDQPLAHVEVFLQRVLWDNPWRSDDLPSLVVESDDGRVIGCLGVMVRPMIFRERRIRAAITNNFMVDPEHRDALVAIRLLRTALGRSQDLTVSDGNGKSRRLWEASGGTTLHSRGFRWLRVLRPARLAVHLLEKKGVPRPVTAPLALVGRLADALATAPRSSPFHVPEREFRVEALEPPRLRTLLERRAKGRSLRPVFVTQEIEWLFSTLRLTRRPQSLRHQVVMSDRGEPVGWFVYFARPGGISIVLQLEAEPPHRTRVAEHLLEDAHDHGSAAVSGQVDPEWCHTLRSIGCLYDHPDVWMLVRAQDPELRCALGSGELFLTRLENESWMRFAF